MGLTRAWLWATTQLTRRPATRRGHSRAQWPWPAWRHGRRHPMDCARVAARGERRHLHLGRNLRDRLAHHTRCFHYGPHPHGDSQGEEYDAGETSASRPGQRPERRDAGSHPDRASKEASEPRRSCAHRDTQQTPAAPVVFHNGANIEPDQLPNHDAQITVGPPPVVDFDDVDRSRKT